MSHQAVERAAALIVRCQPTLRALALRAPPSLRCCQPKLPALAAADPGENSGADVPRSLPSRPDQMRRAVPRADGAAGQRAGGLPASDLVSDSVASVRPAILWLTRAPRPAGAAVKRCFSRSEQARRTSTASRCKSAWGRRAPARCCSHCRRAGGSSRTWPTRYSGSAAVSCGCCARMPAQRTPRAARSGDRVASWQKSGHEIRYPLLTASHERAWRTVSSSDTRRERRCWRASPPL